MLHGQLHVACSGAVLTTLEWPCLPRVISLFDCLSPYMGASYFVATTIYYHKREHKNT